MSSSIRPINPPLDWRTPRTVRMKVSPELCNEWIERNTHNRPCYEERVSMLAADMRAGRFKFNGDSIRFSPEGVLLDGQHRLRAAIKTGFTLDTNVVFGLPTDAQDTMDDQMVRSSAHQLALAGIPNSSQAAAVASLVLLHQRFGVQKSNQMAFRPTKREVNKFVQSDWSGAKQIQAAIQQARKLSRIGVTCAVGGFCYLLFASSDRARAELFFDELASGVGLSEDNPALLLRERLISNNATSKLKMTKTYMFALIFKAWNAYRQELRIRTLRWHNDGPNPESFPTVEFCDGEKP